MKSFFRLALGLSFFAGALAFMNGCGSESVDPTYTYATTSNKGDLAVFTLAGGTMSVAWQIKDNTGGTKKTIDLTLACAAADANFGARRCTVNAGGTCTDGTQACVPATDIPATDSVMYATEAPGIGLMVLPADASQLFVGITPGDCSTNVDGDYLFANMGVSQRELFGLFRLTGGFSSVVHADFASRLPVTAATIEYKTSDVNGVGAFTTTGCANGIRTMTAGGNTFSATLTANGMFVVDKPSGQGGMVAFKVSNAATAADMSGRTLRGFSFPDNSPPAPIKAVLGTASGNNVPLTATMGTVSSAGLTAGVAESGTITKASSVSGGGFSVDLTVTPATGTQAYSTNALSVTYPNPGAIPGLFFIPPFDPSDHGTVFAAVMKTSANKIVMFGVVNNDRTSPPISEATYLPNTGSFIAFEQ